MDKIEVTKRVYEKEFAVKLLLNVTYDQDAQLRMMAKETGMPVSKLIRAGIDQVLSAHAAHGIVGDGAAVLQPVVVGPTEFDCETQTYPGEREA